MSLIVDRLVSDLAERQAAGLYRRRQVVSGPQAPVLQTSKGELLSFCSNDYLGLATDPRLVTALTKAAAHYGVGAGAAHLISGHTAAHHALEEQLAEFVGTERALLFSTGYMANLGVFTALVRAGDLILQDRLNHASLLDGAQLSAGRLRRYRHLDVVHLQRLLASTTSPCLIASDGIFSMDGDSAPYAELISLACAHQATLMIDDAHGFGVLGKQGRGSVDAAQVPIYMATLGKAAGVAGAFVAGSADLIETLIQQARSYVYTTAMPAALAAAASVSLDILAAEEWRRTHLADLIHFFRHEAQLAGLPLLPSETPIQPLMLADADKASAWSQALLQYNILVSAIRPPTVPQGSARLRITLSAAHTKEQVEQLLAALIHISRQHSV
ncbi:MAG: 8-amino-7-oxononanoate synthase [Pseudomonadota bacterium]